MRIDERIGNTGFTLKNNNILSDRLQWVIDILKLDDRKYERRLRKARLNGKLFCSDVKSIDQFVDKLEDLTRKYPKVQIWFRSNIEVEIEGLDWSLN